MSSAVLNNFGVENLDITVQDAVKPAIGDGEVLVEMRLAPVNPADLFSIMGVYPGFQPAALPAFPGLEGMGVVAEVGSSVADKFSTGQRVVPFFIGGDEFLLRGNGSWQKYVVARPEDLFVVPDEVTDDAAAQFVVNPFTAWVMIHELQVPRGEWLVQTAAGSVLGRQVIQMAKHLGIRTINLVRRKDQAAELQALGADVVISTSDEDVVARVKEVTGGKGAWGALDCVGGDGTEQVTGSLRNGGTCLIYGAMAGLTFKGSIVDTLFRDCTIKGFWVTAWSNRVGMERVHALAAELWPLFQSKVVVPYSGQIFPLAQVKEAIGAATAAARGGKVLLAI